MLNLRKYFLFNGSIESLLYVRYNNICNNRLGVLPSINKFDDTKFLRHQILENIRGF